MATSGTLNSGNYDGRYIQFKWTATQSITDNKSTISWTLKGAGDAGAGYYMSGAFKVVIDGSTVYSTSESDRIQLRNGTEVASGTKTLTHKADGTRTFKVYIEAGIYTYAVNCTGETTFTLTTIPRASTVAVSSTSADMGSDVTFTITRASTAFTHKLTYSFEGKTGTIGSDIATSKPWDIPLSLASQIPSKTSGTCVITCITLNGETEIGRKTINMTLKVPSSVIPTVSLTVAEAVQKVADTFGAYVKGLSKLDITAAGSGVYGSTISAHSITFNGATYGKSSIQTGLLTASGSFTVKATATDSRGRIGSKSVTITVKDYDKPYITTFEVVRCDADGTENEEGENAKIVIVGGVTNLTGNSATYVLRYKDSDDSDYTDPPITDTTLTINKTIILNNIDTDLSYEFEFTITDKFYPADASATLGTVFTLVDYHASGKGMAIGKVSEKEGFLEVDLETDFNEPVNINGSINFNSSPWLTVDNTGFHEAVTAYSSRGIEYRKIGTHVYLRGRIVLNEAYAGSNTTLFTLPEGYRPAVNPCKFITGTGVYMGRMFVSGGSGEVILEWVRKLTDGSIVTGAIAWLDISIDYFID